MTSASPIAVGLDGEALEMDPPLVFSSRPGVLRLRLPLGAIGYSPAARATGVKGLLGLWRVVLGRPVRIDAPDRSRSVSRQSSAPVSRQRVHPAVRRLV